MTLCYALRALSCARAGIRRHWCWGPRKSPAGAVPVSISEKVGPALKVAGISPDGMADGIPGSGRMHGDDAEPEKPHAQRSPTTLLLCPMTMTPFHQTIALATHETISHRCMTESEKLRCGKELMRSSL